MKKGYLRNGFFFFMVFMLMSMGYRHDRDPDLYYELGREARFDCVVKISNVEIEDERGSGVLINERFVLTAAHVLLIEETKDTTFVDGMLRYETYVVKGHHLDSNLLNYVVQVKGKDFKVKDVVIHPDYNFRKGRCDIALIELLEPVDGIEFPVLNFNVDELGKVGYLVGFGVVCPGDNYRKITSSDEKMAGMNIIDSIGGYKREGVWAELFCDFDHPSKSKYNVLGDAGALELEGIGLAGDSGGGLFIDTDEGLVLAGLLIGEGNTGDKIQNKVYGTVNKFSRIMAYLKWVNYVTTKD
ncbi:trypsin-like serine protease [Bacteroidota bacterium]